MNLDEVRRQAKNAANTAAQEGDETTVVLAQLIALLAQAIGAELRDIKQSLEYLR